MPKNIQTRCIGMAVWNKGRDDGIKNTKLNIHSAKMLGCMGLCMFNYVFDMPSSLPLLPTAMPTPCLNAFWYYSDPYIFYICTNFFLSCIISVAHTCTCNE